MKDIRDEVGFEIVHFGINCGDDIRAKADAEVFAKLFGLPIEAGRALYL